MRGALSAGMPISIKRTRAGNSYTRSARRSISVRPGELSPEEQQRGAKDMVAYWRYCVELVADRLHRPQSDYASFLIAHREEVEPALSDNEITSLVFGLLLAGHETTTNLSANALLMLLSDLPTADASGGAKPPIHPHGRLPRSQEPNCALLTIRPKVEVSVDGGAREQGLRLGEPSTWSVGDPGCSLIPG